MDFRECTQILTKRWYSLRALLKHTSPPPLYRSGLIFLVGPPALHYADLRTTFVNYKELLYNWVQITTALQSATVHCPTLHCMHCTALYSTVQYSTTLHCKHCTAQYSAVQCCTAQYSFFITVEARLSHHNTSYLNSFQASVRQFNSYIICLNMCY